MIPFDCIRIEQKICEILECVKEISKNQGDWLDGIHYNL